MNTKSKRFNWLHLYVILPNTDFEVVRLTSVRTLPWAVKALCVMMKNRSFGHFAFSQFAFAWSEELLSPGNHILCSAKGILDRYLEGRPFPYGTPGVFLSNEFAEYLCENEDMALPVWETIDSSYDSVSAQSPT